MLIGLIGNQNCGKTTVFNALTGANQHVGNFPGVTIEKKEGFIRGLSGVKIVDLPGIYSLAPYTDEETVTRNFLIKERPDAIINVVDATNIERNLYLTLQILELNIPTVIALNMMDEVRIHGTVIKLPLLEQALSCPVVPIVASKGQGFDDLVSRTVSQAQAKANRKPLDFCEGPTHKAIHSVTHIVEDYAKQLSYPPRFAAVSLIEGEEGLEKLLGISREDRHIIEHIVKEMETVLKTDREAAMADMRYNFIEMLCRQAVIKNPLAHEGSFSLKADKLLTGKVTGIPIFLLIMLSIFTLTFGVFGPILSDGMGWLLDGAAIALERFLQSVRLAPWVSSLLIDGAFAGIGNVLSFLPTILLLFTFLSFLEDSGYMARVAFIMDRPLRKLGLSGRSFVPMLIGFGCSVPAIMATRTLRGKRDRTLTILLTPFMSCSAKLPIYFVITAAIFGSSAPLVVFSLYLLGIITAIVSGAVLSRTVFRGQSTPFVMELPSYRFPSLRCVVLHIWERAKDFLRRAFTLIFLASILIWVLSHIDLSLNYVTDSTKSLLAYLGNLAAPIFVPLGFGDWRIVTALVTGLSAKESVISTLSVLLAGDGASVSTALTQVFSPVSAFSFLVFTLLYSPCVAAMAATKRELGSTFKAFLTVLYQTGTAYVVSFIFYQILSLFWK